MDIDTILKRMDCRSPLFVEFILDKYNDLKQTDPESAHKIETQVFTPSFLRHFLTDNNPFICNIIFSEVPATFFLPVLDDLITESEKNTYSVREERIEDIIRKIAPDLFRDRLVREYRKELHRKPVTIDLFYWLYFFEDFPLDLKHKFFDQSLPLFHRDQDFLSDDYEFDAVLSNLTPAAFILEHPEAGSLAALYLKNKIVDYEAGDLTEGDLCERLWDVLPFNQAVSGYPFEFDLLSSINDESLNPVPVLLDHLYHEGWSISRLQDVYRTLVVSDDEANNSFIQNCLDSTHIPLLKTIIAALYRNKALSDLLKEHQLYRTISVLSAAVIWRIHRNDRLDPALLSIDNIMAFIAIDSTHLPCMEQVKTFLSSLPSEDRTALLHAALDNGLENFSRTEKGVWSITNIIDLMAHFNDPQFLSKFVTVFSYDFEEIDDLVHEKVIAALLPLGDDVFDILEPKIEKLPRIRLADVLILIRRIATEPAEAFFIRHFNLFYKTFQFETIAVCKSLVSEKALALMEHKVGKNQREIDKLFVLITTLTGKADMRTRQILESLPPDSRSDNNPIMEFHPSNSPRPVITLTLECGHCGDISDYDCQHIIAHPHGKFYVADELTCISCNRISEFTINQMGKLMITAELMRMLPNENNGNNWNNPFTGAIQMINSAVKGKPMSLPDGIALYKEEIRKNPANPEHYIGLGNIYKFISQFTFAQEQFEKAIMQGPFYIEPYLALAEIARDKEDSNTALQWLEKGRSFLKRFIICKDIDTTPQEIINRYITLHENLRQKTSSRVMPLMPSEYNGVAGINLKKIGRNEPCPCGSGKKYKKCCLKNK